MPPVTAPPLVPPLVTLLTDFGLRDEYAGVVEAVVLRFCPDARVVHLTHGVPPTNVLAGALALAGSVPFTGVGVHLAVVDPGVGSTRRAVVVRTGDGRLLVGPDNGLLLPAAERCGGVTGAWTITEESLWLHPVSRTFHGRDVFAPVTGHLASGGRPDEVGPAIDAATLTRLEIVPASAVPGRVDGVVLVVDRFGNIAVNATPADLAAAGLAAGRTLEVVVGDSRFYAIHAQTFADVSRGEMVVYEDAGGWIGVAVNQASFADICGVAEGDTVALLAT